MQGITSIGHVAINTADLDASLDFYINTMGFPEMMRINHDNGDVWLVYLRVTDDQFIEIFPGAETDKTSPSWHANGFGHLCLMVDDLVTVVDDLKGKGVTMMIEPKSGADGNSQAYWQSLGDKLATGAAVAKPHGLKVAWHNHDFEYVALPDGTRPIEHILNAGNPDVLFEIDCGWIVRAGADPAAELKRYADRIVAIQLKDTAPLGTRQDDGWTATGDGIIDWAALVPLFRATKADHIVAEHDNPGDWQAFARRSIDHMKTLGL
jgi:sugar phosphate isomerase/epimerase